MGTKLTSAQRRLKQRLVRLNERIGELMSQRVLLEEKLAESVTDEQMGIARASEGR